MKKIITVLMILTLFIIIVVVYLQHFKPREVLAGWRSSIYGYQQERPPEYWVNVADDMSSKVRGIPSGIWVIGDVMDNGFCNLEFPSNDSYQNIAFSNNDVAEKYLDAFDSSGTRVWLQVEPGNADVGTLIDLVMSRYSNHSSVIGFGVDVEWLEDMYFKDGRPVTNNEVNVWLEKVRSYNQNYMLFLKHWKKEKMPSEHPEGIVFMSDSQNFESYDEMMDDFLSWGRSFSDAQVAYQYGYDVDRGIWGHMEDPFAEIGNDIMRNISNCVGVYWVDFTIAELYG